jgi:hypothetical protein
MTNDPNLETWVDRVAPKPDVYLPPDNGPALETETRRKKERRKSKESGASQEAD